MAAELAHGDCLMVNYTPAADVTAGEMVKIGELVMVAHRDIAADDLGALSFPNQNCVYRVDLATGQTYSVGDTVKVDLTTQDAKTAGAEIFGVCVEADVDQAAGDEYVLAAFTGPSFGLA